MEAIRTSELRYRYRGEQQWTLSGVSIGIDAGSCVLLLGPSGSGKSTLARCFNGLIPHSMPGELDGLVRVCGRDTTDFGQAELARRVGLVFQNPDSQFVTETVETEVAFGLENLCLPRDEISTRIGTALGAVGISGFETRQIETLSGGEKQRLAIACQLAMEPEVLILDEPTANLDPQGTEAVHQLLRELAGDDSRTIVLIEHQCESLLDVVDETFVLDRDGEPLVEGTPETVFADNAQRLRRNGVWIPEVTRLALDLRSNGVWPDSTPVPVTVEEATETVSSLLTDDDGQAPADSTAKTVDQSDRAVNVAAIDGGATAAALEVRGLDAAYENGGTPRRALRNVSLTVPDGSFLALVGPNGAGKSTLAKHTVGVLSPPPETVFVDGRDVTTLPSREISQHVGYVFQNPEHQFVADSVRDELAYGLRQLDFDAEDVERKVEQALDRFDLAAHADANPFTLSHGEKRRLSVATMLVVGQDVLIVDEPTYGQDRANADALMETLSELHDAGQTVVVLTHDMRIVAEYADSVAVLVDGEIQFRGTPSALFADRETLSSARLSRPPLATLTDRLPELSGPSTVEHYRDRCTGDSTAVSSHHRQESAPNCLNSGEGR